MHSAATHIDPVGRSVQPADGQRIDYDYLVIVTGYRNKDDVVPGFRENAKHHHDARRGRAHRGGPAVVPARARATWLSPPPKGADWFGAAYEFLFNTSYQLRKAGLHKQVKLTCVTAEPFLGASPP